jgi:hypothetical protein
VPPDLAFRSPGSLRSRIGGLSWDYVSCRRIYTNIVSKLGASDRAHGVTIALKRGIIVARVDSERCLIWDPTKSDRTASAILIVLF